jgi:hypothetical protein
MAEFKEPRTLGSTPGTTGMATHSTETDSTNTNGIVGKVKEQATAQLSSQKDRATDGLGSVAQAVRQTTQHLRDNQNDTVARYAEQAAEQIERFSERLRNKDVGELMNDAQQLARRQPALFVGGAFAIGLLGARFLKSSSPDSRSSYGNYGTGGSGSGGYGAAGYGGERGSGGGSYGYGNQGYASGSAGGSGASGYGGNQTSDIGLTGTGLGTGTTGSSTSGFDNTSESMRGSAGTTTGTSSADNAYGNKVPGSAGKASKSNKKTDYPSTEGR